MKISHTRKKNCAEQMKLETSARARAHSRIHISKYTRFELIRIEFANQFYMFVPLLPWLGLAWPSLARANFCGATQFLAC